MEEQTMKESVNNTNNFPAENQSEREDNYLSYEQPQLRKHGKVHNMTTFIFFRPASIDGLPDFSDIS
jgi:hypothetical protein